MDVLADDRALYGGEPLPVGSKGRLSSGWWGMIAVIATEDDTVEGSAQR